MKRASLLTLTLIGAFSAIQAAWAVDYPATTNRQPTGWAKSNVYGARRG